jgi:hypothetical protein
MNLKVWVTIHNDALYCHENEKHLNEIDDIEGVVAVLALSGAHIKAATLGFPYGILVKGHRLSAELDAESLPTQKEWLHALRAAIEVANINAIHNGKPQSCPLELDLIS